MTENPLEIFNTGIPWLSLSLFLAFAVLVWFLVRGIMLWYWRVNRIVTLLEEIRFLLLPEDARREALAEAEAEEKPREL